jgi:hypothetical protein
MEPQTEQLVKCTNCKVSRTQENFIGKRGDTVRQCLKFLDKDYKQKKRPEVIEKRNERSKEKKYYVKYRENKREENEEEYLRHNAETAKNWRDNNKEHLSAYRTKNFKYRFGAIKQQARKKGIPWNEDLTDEMCYILMTSKCFYCDFVSEDTLNGIDRMDNNGDYEKKNTVSCCKKCNFIKCSLDPRTFIKRCKHISKHFGGNGVLDESIWPDSKSAPYTHYLSRALKKNLEFTLTKEEFINFTNDDCFYCDKSASMFHSNGVDRLNNNSGYTTSNCVSCCSECNFMKGALTRRQFIETCKKVAEHLINDLAIPEIKKCEKSIAKRPRKF